MIWLMRFWKFIPWFDQVLELRTDCLVCFLVSKSSRPNCEIKLNTLCIEYNAYYISNSTKLYIKLILLISSLAEL